MAAINMSNGVKKLEISQYFNERYIDIEDHNVFIFYLIKNYTETLDLNKNLVSPSYEEEMNMDEKKPITLNDFLTKALEFILDNGLYFNSHYGPICEETKLIIPQLYNIISKSNKNYTVVTSDSQPFGCIPKSERFEEYIQKPYVGVQILSYSKEKVLNCTERLNDQMKRYRYIHLIHHGGYSVYQTFSKQVYYISFMFGVTTPDYYPDYKEDILKDLKSWENCFDYVKNKWWDDIANIIETCVC